MATDPHGPRRAATKPRPSGSAGPRRAGLASLAVASSAVLVLSAAPTAWADTPDDPVETVEVQDSTAEKAAAKEKAEEREAAEKAAAKEKAEEREAAEKAAAKEKAEEREAAESSSSPSPDPTALEDPSPVPSETPSSSPSPTDISSPTPSATPTPSGAPTPTESATPAEDPSLTAPGSVTMGSTFDVAGSGFTPGDTVALSGADVGIATVDESGGFVVSATAPGAPGPVTISATSATNQTASVVVEVQSPAIEVLTPTVWPGDDVTVSGQNYLPGETVIFTGDISGSATADPTGAFTFTFSGDLEPGDRGFSTTSATSGVTLSGTFTVAGSGAVSAASTTVGQPLVVTFSDFTPGSTVTVTATNGSQQQQETVTADDSGQGQVEFPTGAETESGEWAVSATSEVAGSAAETSATVSPPNFSISFDNSVSDGGTGNIHGDGFITDGSEVTVRFIAPDGTSTERTRSVGSGGRWSTQLPEPQEGQWTIEATQGLYSTASTVTVSIDDDDDGGSDDGGSDDGGTDDGTDDGGTDDGGSDDGTDGGDDGDGTTVPPEPDSGEGNDTSDPDSSDEGGPDDEEQDEQEEQDNLNNSLTQGSDLDDPAGTSDETGQAEAEEGNEPNQIPGESSEGPDLTGNEEDQSDEEETEPDDPGSPSPSPSSDPTVSPDDPSTPEPQSPAPTAEADSGEGQMSVLPWAIGGLALAGVAGGVGFIAWKRRGSTPAE